MGSLGLKMSYQLDPHQVITKDESNRRSLRGWPQTPGVQFFQPHAPLILRADELIPMVKHQFAMAQFFGRPKNLDAEDFKYYIVRLEHDQYDQYLLLHRV